MPPRTKSKAVPVRVTPERAEAWQQAADAAGMSRNAWMISILDAAAGNSELPKQLLRAIRASRA